MSKRENDGFDVQAKTIMKLQDKIRVLEFEISEKGKEVSAYKLRIKQTRGTMLRARDALVEINKNGDYEKVNTVIRMLRDVGSDE